MQACEKGIVRFRAPAEEILTIVYQNIDLWILFTDDPSEISNGGY